MKNGLNPFPENLNDTDIIILGSFPGEESLDEPKEYYKKKNNQFWKLIGYKETDYEKRKNYLICNKIGLWDVFKKCKRVDANGHLSSKDEDIIEGEFNNLNQLPESKLFFNGKSAYAFFCFYKENNYKGIYRKEQDYLEFKKKKRQIGKLDNTPLPVLPSSSRGNPYPHKEVIWKNKLNSVYKKNI